MQSPSKELAPLALNENAAVRHDLVDLLQAGTPLIDVRAPIEFARGALPGAVNLPVMNDDERHRVGIEYKRAGQQAAIALGARLVDETLRTERVASWIDFARQNPHGALYCFRGGLRSRISQQWLCDAGIDYPRLGGGYKAARNSLIESLDIALRQLPLCLVGGRTAAGKTRLLERWPRSINLEGLARHRGSSFGGTAGSQPSNIDFEHAVTLALMQQARHGLMPVCVEDEGRMIGQVCLPPSFRQSMEQAPIVLLETPFDERVEFSLQDYVSDLLLRYERVHGTGPEAFEHFSEHHRGSLDRVQKRLGGVRHREALALLEAALTQHRAHASLAGYRPFIALMLEHYYDPMYDYQLRTKSERVCFRGSADEVLAWLAGQSTPDG